MPGLLPNVDPDGLLEFSVVYTDRALNHMSRSFQGVMRDISAILKDVYKAHATALVPGIAVNGGLGTYLAVSVLFGLVNAMVGPILQWLVGSQSWLRLGSSALVVNSTLFAVTAGLSANLDIVGLGSAVLGAVVVSVTATLLELVIRPAAPTGGP